jgi:hypothetical protein
VPRDGRSDDKRQQGFSISVEPASGWQANTLLAIEHVWTQNATKMRVLVPSDTLQLKMKD